MGVGFVLDGGELQLQFVIHDFHRFDEHVDQFLIGVRLAESLSGGTRNHHVGGSQDDFGCRVGFVLYGDDFFFETDHHVTQVHVHQQQDRQHAQSPRWIVSFGDVAARLMGCLDGMIRMTVVFGEMGKPDLVSTAGACAGAAFFVLWILNDLAAGIAMDTF